MAGNPTSNESLDRIITASATATKAWASASATTRATALNSIADHLDRTADDLVAIAQRETNLDNARLHSELTRTTFQLRLFAGMVVEGSYLDARIDHADPVWQAGTPRPDIRRVMEPIGPVLVFAASNFPFAFSVAGGDTASALAAGCAVMVKAHSGHPALSEATERTIHNALTRVGAPPGLFALIFGTEAGKSALRDPRIKAGSFTGSIIGGRALFDIANARPEPIPFFAEMGSINPTFVTKSADTSRGREIAQGFLTSMAMGSGQFCTKPGVLVLPEESVVLEHLRTVPFPETGRLLNRRIHDGYVTTLRELSSHSAVDTIKSLDAPYADPPTPTLLHTTVEDLLRDPGALLTECFGPAALVVTYQNEATLLDVAGALEGQLTATIHAEKTDDLAQLVRLLADRAGRILWNQWPTGVSVTYAQQHGGPYPATTWAGSTSVGTAAVQRFLRPVAYQGFPEEWLPLALREANPLGIARMVDGELIPRDRVRTTRIG